MSQIVMQTKTQIQFQDTKVLSWAIHQEARARLV